MKRILLAALVVAGTSTASVAATISIGGTDYFLQSHFYAGANDCAGVFGRGFDRCAFAGSPIVAKIDGATGAVTVSPLYPTVDGSEFDVTGMPGTSGTFSYTPGTSDPAVRFWVAKAGRNFSVFWITLTDTALDPGTNALAIPIGADVAWNTNVQQGLSHLSFYDTGVPVFAGNFGSSVPEPAVLALFGVGLFAAGRRLRR